MTVLDDLATSLRSVAATAAPSVVRIGRDLRGCGTVAGPGLVVTNAHNLRGAETTVTFHDGRQATATVAAADVDGDLAVLRVETADTPALAWAGSDPVEPGTPVIAVGGGPTAGSRVTLGFVSGVEQSFRGPRGRRVTGAVEHTAPLARGSSGGPILDAAGRLVGINTHRLGDGFYLAVPADDDLRARIDRLAAGDAPRHRRLGVGVAPAAVARKLRRSVGLPERDGLLVRAVEDGGPAARAGIRAGDLLVRAGAVELRTADDLYQALDALGSGETLTVAVVRGADDLTVSVAFDDGGDAPREEGTA